MKKIVSLLFQCNNAEWSMQLVWPMQADYVIVHLDKEYRRTIVAREQRDYVWIMARTPNVSPPITKR